MDIIKTNISKSLSQFVETVFFNNYLLNASIKFKKNFFILLLVVYSRFQVFIETTLFLIHQSKEQVKTNTFNPLSLKLIFTQNKFLKSDSFLLTL